MYFHRSIPENKNPKKLKINNENWELFSNELLLIKEVSLDLVCAIEANYANIAKMYALKVKQISELRDLSTYYFLALFNSKLLDFYFRVVFWNTHLSGGYLNYHASYLSILPILNINPSRLVYKYIILLSKTFLYIFNFIMLK